MERVEREATPEPQHKGYAPIITGYETTPGTTNGEKANIDPSRGKQNWGPKGHPLENKLD